MRLDAPLPPYWRKLFTDDAIVAEPGLWDAVTEAGESGLRAVCAVLDARFGEAPVPTTSPMARELAAKALQHFARPDLVPWMFQRLHAAGPDDPVTPILADAIAACGGEASATACADFASPEADDALRPWLADIIAHAGTRSPAALEILTAYVRFDPVHGAELLADYGDPAGAPALLAEFDRTVAEDEGGDSLLVTVLGWAVLTVGGDLGPEREAIWRRGCDDTGTLCVASRRRMIERGGFGGPVPRLPDDAPCVCESGKPYAACCAALEADLHERALLRRLAPRGVG